VTDVWIGDPADPPAESRSDMLRGLTLATITGVAFALIAAGVLSL
jgi:hypothetical protein